MIPLLAFLLGSTPLEVGAPAPDFTLPDTDGQPVTLSKLLEKGPVIVAFYPRAMTPGCTRQNEALRDHIGDVLARGAQVIGISTDPVDRQREFKAKSRIPYPLLSDPKGEVVEKYSGKMALLGFAHRANFVIGQDGKVKAIVEGNDAIDPTSAIAACPLRKGTP